MKIFGILNITPDSFSDGGQYDNATAIDAALKMVKLGAVAIDIGAESTRPDAQAITPEEEWNRLEPVLKTLSLNNIIISVDTRNQQTARRALECSNVKYLNDVSGFHNAEMIELAAASNSHIIVMHSLTIPADKNIILTSPPIETLQTWIMATFERLNKSGIKADKIIFDPGIGFGKSAEQSRELIDNAAILTKTCHKLGSKILYGHSRKSFLGGDVAFRDAESAKISSYLQNAGVDYIRVHNVEINMEALNKQEKAN